MYVAIKRHKPRVGSPSRLQSKSLHDRRDLSSKQFYGRQSYWQPVTDSPFASLANSRSFSINMANGCDDEDCESEIILDDFREVPVSLGSQ